MRRPTWIAIVLIAVVLIAWMAFRAGRSVQPVDSPSRAQTVAARGPSGSNPTAASSPSAALDGGASGAASRFVKAWLDTHAGTRRAGLEAVCTPRLAGLLAVTDAAKVPDAVPDGVPVMVRQDAAGVTYRQRLSDGTWVAVDLVPDPTRTADWVVTAVRPVET